MRGLAGVASLVVALMLFSGHLSAAAVDSNDIRFAGDSATAKIRDAGGFGQRGGAARSESDSPGPAAVEPAALPVGGGIQYTYVRACLVGVDFFLDPLTCPQVNAQCDTEPNGVLVSWIEVNNNVQPPTETPTGRSSCMYPGEAPVPPVEGEAAVEDLPVVLTLEEFQKQPVLAALIASQPSNFGLRNAHSNVYAQAQEQEFTFEFQDALIVLQARPVSYAWNYGDGTSMTTTSPGGPVVEGAFDVETVTSHQYAETGDFNVTLTTFFAGDYSVDGGPFQPVAGEAAVVSDPHLMSIWRTEGYNVSENCIENPTGIGCEAPIR